MGFKSRAKKLKDAAQAGKPKDSGNGKGEIWSTAMRDQRLQELG